MLGKLSSTQQSARLILVSWDLFWFLLPELCYYMICIHVFCKHRFSSFAPANVGPIKGKQPDAPCRTINIDFPVMIGEWFWFGASTYLIPPNPLGMLLAQPTWRASWGQNHPLYTVKLSLSWPWGLKGAVGPNFGKPKTCQANVWKKWWMVTGKPK